MPSSTFLPSTLTLVGVVGSPATNQNPDGSQSSLMMGRAGDLLQSEVRGKYGSMAHRAGVFWAASTTAGIAIPIVTAAAAALAARVTGCPVAGAEARRTPPAAPAATKSPNSARS